jgi:hypothetical protein
VTYVLLLSALACFREQADDLAARLEPQAPGIQTQTEIGLIVREVQVLDCLYQ